MRRVLTLLPVVFLSLVLTLATACDDTTEEDILGDDDEALTAEQVLAEVIRATASLDSVQIETAYEGGSSDTVILTGEGYIYPPYRSLDARFLRRWHIVQLPRGDLRTEYSRVALAG